MDYKISRFELAQITKLYESARQTEDPSVGQSAESALRRIGLSLNCSRFELAQRKKEIEVQIA